MERIMSKLANYVNKKQWNKLYEQRTQVTFEEENKKLKKLGTLEASSPSSPMKLLKQLSKQTSIASPTKFGRNNSTLNSDMLEQLK